MTPTAMEFDELKRAWQQIDRRLERQHALALAQFLEGRMRRMQSGLRPLYWGQVVQAAFGVVCVLAAAQTWFTRWDVVHLRLAGLIVHAYGVVAVLAAGRTLALIHRLDPTAPVLVIQRQIAELRHWHVVSGLALGLPWWFLWMPVFMLLAAQVGVDVFVRAPRLLVYGAGIGVAGLAVTGALHWLARRPGWTRMAHWADETVVAESLRRAQTTLDEVQHFSREDLTSSAVAPAGRAGTASPEDRD